MRKGALSGYAGNMLHVDLSEGTVHRLPITHELIVNYIGGFGFTAKLVYDFVPAGIDPLSPGNALVIGAPVLGGTFAPTGGRTVVMAKSPLTGSLGISHMGEPGAMMKFAGCDQLVVTGKAVTPSYIKIQNGDVQIAQADHLWGLDIAATTDALWRELGGEFYVSCIGPAGEHLVRFANIISNKFSTAGRCGLGAVMGSKNLKAIAVFGDGEIGVARRSRFGRIANEAFRKLMESQSPPLDIRRTYGSLSRLSYDYPRENWRLRYRRDGRAVGPTEAFDAVQFDRRLRERNVTCFACPIGCKQEVRLKQGEFAGSNFAISCPMGTMIRPFSLQLAVDKYEDVARCAQVNNMYGMDAHVIDHAIKLFIELQHQGIVTREMTDGLVLDWGDTTVIMELLRRTALREGVGDVLAEGPVGACRKLGLDPDEYVIHAKGNPISVLMDPRIRFGPEVLGAFVNPRRGHFDFHRPALAVAAMSADLPYERVAEACKRLGVPEGEMRQVITGEGQSCCDVARLTKYSEDYSIVTYCLGVCEMAFSCGAYDIEICAHIFSALTGIELSSRELLQAGERIWTLQRMFNIREGDTRKDDRIARIYTQQKLRTLGKEYPAFSEAAFTRTLDEYYALRGWDEEGTPTKATLARLSLQNV